MVNYEDALTRFNAGASPFVKARMLESHSDTEGIRESIESEDGIGMGEEVIAYLQREKSKRREEPRFRSLDEEVDHDGHPHAEETNSYTEQ